ncbi:MAG: hypothetical protein ACKO2L_02535 [Planctomycetaceae bacterium]
MSSSDPLGMSGLSKSQRRELWEEAWEQVIDSEQIDSKQIDSEVDDETIAACASGLLEPADRDAVLQRIYQSASAIEKYLAARHLTESVLPQSQVSPAQPSSAEFLQNQKGSLFRSSVLRLVSAGLLVALLAGILIRNQQLSNSLATLSAKDSEQQRKLTELQLLTCKLEATLLAAQRGSAWVVGRINPGLVGVALLEIARNRGGVEESLAVSRELDERWKQSVDELRSESQESTEAGIEDALRLLTGLSLKVFSQDADNRDVNDHFQPATAAVDKLLLQSPDDPRVLNLQAVLLLTKSVSIIGEERAALEKQAEEILKAIVARHPDFMEALLNLALLTRNSDPETARTLFEKFIQQSDDPELSAAVKQYLEP